MNWRSKSSSSSNEPGSGRQSLSVWPRHVSALSPGILRRIADLADEIRLSDPRIGVLPPFGTGVRKGIGAGPSVWFGDTAEIPLLGLNTRKRFDYRLGWLAQDRDVVVIGGADCPAFEAYQRSFLGAPGISYLNVDPDAARPRRATPTICLRNPVAFSKLCDVLAGEDTVTLQAYITTGTIWALAARVNQATGADVFVAGPPPLLSRRANNKLWFGEVAQKLLGTGAIPPKRVAYSKSALTRHVGELAREWDRLVIKVPDSAGSAGNFPVKSEDVRGLKPAALNRYLMHVLSSDDRPPVFPILVEVWDANVLTSPSVQIWIPAPEDGPPLVEEIFEQLLHGEQASFSGAVLADLPPEIENTLTSGALQLATLFQQLGYFGRCSFDAIVTGPDIEAGAVHWIECNGRWGGASIPMSLVHRLPRPGDQPRYTIVQSDKGRFRALDFADAVREFADVAPLPDLGSGVLFLSPNMMQLGTGCHFLSLASDTRAATELALVTVDRLRGS